MEKATKPATYNYADHEGDWIVGQFFTPADLRLTPEEYAARNAQDWGCFSFHLYRFRDPILGVWIRRLREILANEEEIERCRQHYLTADELTAVKKRTAEEF